MHGMDTQQPLCTLCCSDLLHKPPRATGHAPCSLQALQPQGDERLLKLYESGLPGWAIYGPLYGLPYRPWLRTLSYALFIAVSVFSMVMGFYDVIKHFPLLHRVRACMQRPSLPPPPVLWSHAAGSCSRSAIRSWAEAAAMHAQVLSGLVSSLRLPSTAIFQWLDGHVQACAVLSCMRPPAP